MAKTDLTADRLRELLDYDPETGEFTWREPTSRRVRVGSVAGKPNKSIQYRQIRIDYALHYSHRLAWLHTHGKWPDGVIDHINGDRADNRLSNLRDVSQQANSQNQCNAQARNPTGLLGVSWDSKRKKFVAGIKTGYRRKALGRYDVAEEAHAAYLAAKRKLHEGCTI